MDKRRIARRRSASWPLVLSACSRRRRRDARAPSTADGDRRRRGRAHRPGLAGLRRERRDRPGVRLGQAVRGRDRLQGHASRSSGRPTRRSACSSTNPEQFDVISASGDASLRLVRAGYVQPVNVDLVDELRRHLPGPQGQAVQHGRRRPLRHPARPRREPADVADRQGRLRRRRAGPQMFDPTSAVRRQGLGLRRADLHRRRGRRPDEDQARARDQEPVRPRRHPVRRRRSTC